MDRCKIRLILILVFNIFILSSCSKVNDVKDKEIKMMVVLSDDFNFFAGTYFRYYNKNNELIKEEKIKDAGFYYNKIIENEMFLLGGTYPYVVNLNDFSYKKLDFIDDKEVILDKIDKKNNVIGYIPYSYYSKDIDDIKSDFCLYNLSNEKKKCTIINSDIKDYILDDKLIYLLLGKYKDSYSEVIILDYNLHVVSSHKFNDSEFEGKFATRLIKLDDIYVKVSDVLYDFNKNIVYKPDESKKHFFLDMFVNNEKLNIVYMGNPSSVCDINNECYEYNGALFQEGFSENNGIVFTKSNDFIKKTVIDDIILLENNEFKNITTIKYRQGLNVVGIYYK